MANRSPWIHQLKADRESVSLSSDVETGVAIVGAGIAGISTAYFLLSNTDGKVIILEKGKFARGATGHNAGQIASYFERPFHELVGEFGLEKAAEAQLAIESAWALLDRMYTEAGLTLPLSRFIGHAGLSTLDQVVSHLRDNQCRKQAGLRVETFKISKDAPFIASIPAEYADLYEVVSKDDIDDLLQTKNTVYHAVLSFQKGCLNSALFCEEMIAFMSKTYPERFALYEHSLIRKVVLRQGLALLDAGKHTVTAGRVILCTNGFEGFTILNEGGLAIDTKFHHLVRGMVGYMSAYIEPMNKPPVAISYFEPAPVNSDDPYAADPYFYLTRRQFDADGVAGTNLISVGGPEFSLDERMEYTHELEYPDQEKARIDAFVKSTYDTDPNKKIDYQFTWHGLMGYTPSGVRLVGAEPKNSVLLYNLGCNGVGILPSIYGAERISRIVAGENMPPSIFDPKG
jgi:glycine/D-amino acid oxidase-like deaminating enzyme